MTLTSVGEPDDAKGKTISEIGSMLFTRGVSGTRVVTGRDTKVIEGYTFKGEFRKSLNGPSLGGIQVLRHQRGGWVGWPNDDV